jgi:hypothetical protein
LPLVSASRTSFVGEHSRFLIAAQATSKQLERYAKLPKNGCKNIKMILHKNLIRDIIEM